MSRAPGIAGCPELAAHSGRAPERREQPEDTSRTRVLRQFLHIHPGERPALIVHGIGIVLQIRHVKDGTIPEAKLLFLVFPFGGIPVHLTGNVDGVFKVLA